MPNPNNVIFNFKGCSIFQDPFTKTQKTHNCSHGRYIVSWKDKTNTNYYKSKYNITSHQTSWSFQNSGEQSSLAWFLSPSVTNKHLSALGELKMGSPPKSGKTFGRQFLNFMVVFSLPVERELIPNTVHATT